MAASFHQNVNSQVDVEQVRRAVRSLARELNFSMEETEGVVIATAELATNLLRYGLQGRLLLVPITDSKDTRRLGLEIESRDHGPGIANVDLALQDGFSTGGGLGSGLPAICRLMDEVVIESAPTGTSIVARKWACQ